MRPKDQPPSAGDRYARESFTLRRMTRKQIWALAGAAVAAFVVAVVAT